MYAWNSKSSPTSTASARRPSRLEMVAAPARSWRVKMMPWRPRAAWLWSIWSASVDLPQSIVPEKNTSSAMGGQQPFGRGGQRAGSAADFEQGHELFDGGHRAVQADHLGLAGLAAGGDDRDVVAGGGDHVADPGQHALVHRGAEPARGDGLFAGGDPHLLAEHLAPHRVHVGGRAGVGVDVAGPALAAEQGDAGRQLPVLVEVDPVLRGDVDHAVVGGDV